MRMQGSVMTLLRMRGGWECTNATVLLTPGFGIILII